MAKIKGTNIVSAVTPFTTADEYPTHYAKYGNGGWQEVATLADRNAIAADRREAGMAVYVVENQKVYILSEDLITWNILESGKVDDVKVDGHSVVIDKIAEIDLTGKLDKVHTANQVYGTDSEGDQTTYNVDSFGQVDDVQVNGTSVVENKVANIEIGDGTLTIQKNGNTVGTFTANQSGNTTVNIEADVQQQADWNEVNTSAPDYIKNKPTQVSDFSNDADYQSGADVAASIAAHNEDPEAHADIRAEIAELDEWTPTQYEATTTNFVVGNPYTVEEAFQRTASLFAGTQGEIDTINGKIPAQASSSNQLADKNFVNSTVASNAANFRGNWATWANVPTNANDYPVDYAGNKTPTNNDYLVVDDASDYNVQNDGAWRFIYVGDWATDGKAGWNPAYRIGHAFTADQQAAIDSGITATMVDNYVDPTSTASTAYNARITAVETDKRDVINSASKIYATDANGANKNDLGYDTAATANTIVQRTAGGEITTATPTANTSATTKLYVDTILATKQDVIQVSTMPTASASEEGRIVQWIGSDGTYTNGYFYKCVLAYTDATEIVHSGSPQLKASADIETFKANVLEGKLEFNTPYIYEMQGGNWWMTGSTLEGRQAGLVITGPANAGDQVKLQVNSGYAWVEIAVETPPVTIRTWGANE